MIRAKRRLLGSGRHESLPLVRSGSGDEAEPAPVRRKVRVLYILGGPYDPIDLVCDDIEQIEMLLGRGIAPKQQLISVGRELARHSAVLAQGRGPEGPPIQRRLAHREPLLGSFAVDVVGGIRRENGEEGVAQV